MARQIFLLIIASFLWSCQTVNAPQSTAIDPVDHFAGYGKLSIVQAATSTTETFINVMGPRNRDYKFYVLLNGKPAGRVDVVEIVDPSPMLFKIYKLRVSELNPNTEYRLEVRIPYGDTIADYRTFKTFPAASPAVRFAVGSCFSDDFVFSHVREAIWQHMFEQNPDFILLNGDLVYVDTHDFVPREKATESDVWQRYIHSMEIIPLFHKERLIPVVATWDDHDYGTNDGNKNFAGKDFSRRAFRALFSSDDIKGVYENGAAGVYKTFSLSGQRFFLMDNRTFREPNGSAQVFAHWGKAQHSWLLEHLKSNDQPAWLVNGGQYFAPPIIVGSESNQPRQLNESLMADHPAHFRQLMKDLKESNAPVIFVSGDIHFSEILEVEATQLGYTTYEVTSSPIHSYLFRNKPGEPELWANPRRVVGAKDHNYILVESRVTPQGWEAEVKSYGVKRPEPLFAKKLVIKK